MFYFCVKRFFYNDTFRKEDLPAFWNRELVYSNDLLQPLNCLFQLSAFTCLNRLTAFKMSSILGYNPIKTTNHFKPNKGIVVD